MPLPLLLGGLSIGAGLLGSYLGYEEAGEQRRAAQRQLDALNKIPLPRFGVNPAVQRFYRQALNESVNPRGYLPEEVGRFKQNLAQQGNAQYANATSMAGGNLGRAISFLGSSSRLRALSDFAAGDANLRVQNQRNAYGRTLQGANYFQNADNANTQAALTRRLMTEQALGGAISSNRDYQRNMIGNIGTDLIGGGIGLLGMGRRTPGVNYATYSRYNPSRAWLNMGDGDTDVDYYPQ